jgi:uncharacterized protein YndB with AHSA1/START domain
MAKITVSRAIDAPKELLWNYLTTDSGLSCWQADSVNGTLESGQFSLRWPKLGARLDLKVIEAERERRLVLRAGRNVLELRLEDGEVSLSHGGLSGDDDLAGFRSSWNAALSLLELAATRHPGSSREIEWLFERAPTEATLAQCFFTDPEALSSWLGTSQNPLTRGEGYSLQLFGGQTLSGEVLFDERDVCLHASEIEDGAVSLRTLPGGEGQRILAIGISTWGSSCPLQLRASLEGALHRLARLMRSGQREFGSFD